MLETGHTLVLGWSPRLPVILSELVIANANQRRAGFVILAERPKDEMEDELRRLVPNTGHDPGRLPHRRPEQAGRPGAGQRRSAPAR